MTDTPPDEGRTPPNSRGAVLALHVHAVLRDGRWHYWEDVIRQVAPKVPRGMAYRHSEKERTRQHQRRHGPDSLPPYRPITEAAVRSGAKAFITEAVRSWRKWIERDEKTGRVRLLATPPRLAPYIPEDERLLPVKDRPPSSEPSSSSPLPPAAGLLCLLAS